MVESAGSMLEHVGRSAAVRRALDAQDRGPAGRAGRARNAARTRFDPLHKSNCGSAASVALFDSLVDLHTGLISTYVASEGRARALELGRQFLRTDAAMDLAVGAVLKHADTSKPQGIDTDLSPSGPRRASAPR